MSVVFSQGFETRTLEKLNALAKTIPVSILNSPRSIGDTIQDLIGAHFLELMGKEICKTYSSESARRSMADVAFEDFAGNYYSVDIKTHNLGTKFNMPNLTSVERLARLYESDTDFFCVLLIAYAVENSSITFQSCKFVPIEHIDWNCLTIGALGWGQIQIANSNNFLTDKTQTRKTWMIELCDTLLNFYPREIAKISERIEHFRVIREKWLAK
jgi:hypothetical protein